MSETSERFRRVADQFTARVEQVPADAWSNQAPCEGWTARDVVGHVVDTAGFFTGRAGVELPTGPSIDDDPAGAWATARDGVQGALDDDTLAGAEFDAGPMGTMTLNDALERFGIADVLIHTWDLARAAGLDERLDTDEVERVYAALLPNDEMMRGGTAFGPKVDVPDDADTQTKLIAFTGRMP